MGTVELFIFDFYLYFSRIEFVKIIKRFIFVNQNRTKFVIWFVMEMYIKKEKKKKEKNRVKKVLKK